MPEAFHIVPNTYRKNNPTGALQISPISSIAMDLDLAVLVD
jgi:hypothetical protein